MKRILFLLFVPLGLFAQRITIDSAYYKPTNTSSGRWISSKTSIGTDNTKLPISDTVKRTKVATRKMVDSLITVATFGGLQFIANYNASSNQYPTVGSGNGGSVMKGDWWKITTGGVLGGDSARINDKIYAVVDNPAQISTNWDKVSGGTASTPTRLAGDSRKGAPTYNGNVALNGSFSSATSYTTNSDTLKYHGLLSTNKLLIGKPGSQYAKAFLNPYTSGTGLIAYDFLSSNNTTSAKIARFYDLSSLKGLNITKDAHLQFTTNTIIIYSKDGSYTPVIIGGGDDNNAALTINQTNSSYNIASFKYGGVEKSFIHSYGGINLGAGTTSAGTAPLKFNTQVSGLSSVEDGTIEYIGKSLQLTNNGKRRGIVQSFNVIESTNGILNDTTENTIFTVSHEANSLEVGKVEKSEIYGIINSVTDANANTCAIKIKYAGTTYGTITIPEATRSSVPYKIVLITTCKGIGSGSTTIQIYAKVEVDGEANLIAIRDLATNKNSTTNENTTITAKWTDKASGGNSIYWEQGYTMSIEKGK